MANMEIKITKTEKYIKVEKIAKKELLIIVIIFSIILLYIRRAEQSKCHRTIKKFYRLNLSFYQKAIFLIEQKKC